jgi:hypothetical protein
MKTGTIILGALVGVALLQGCATKTYGRQGGLTDFERNSLSCREIDVDIARTDGFIQRVNSESKFDGKDVLAFLGDFGIGNNMEKSAALESANTRMSQLNSLRAAKCGAYTPEAAPAIGSPGTPGTTPAMPGCGWIGYEWKCRR